MPGITIGPDSAYPEARHKSAVNDVHETLSGARELAARVESIVDRLVGPVPAAGSNADAQEPPYSVFDLLRDDSRATSARIATAHEALNRLEEALP